jgi:hypothetical protein
MGVLPLACLGCGASQKIMGQPVHKQVAIVVRISDEVNQADNAGGVAELVETVEKGLKDEGMDSEVYTSAEDHPPPPRIELNVVFWSEPSTASRQLVVAGALAWPLGIAGAIVGPDDRMIVDCAVTLDASERRLFWRRFDADRGFGGQGDASAGHNAGSQILRHIFRDSPEAAMEGAVRAPRGLPPQE